MNVFRAKRQLIFLTIIVAGVFVIIFKLFVKLHDLKNSVITYTKAPVEPIPKDFVCELKKK